MTIQCFWLEKTLRARRSLRRYHSSDVRCSGPMGYHDAMVTIDEVPVRKKWEYGDAIVQDYAGADDVDAFKDDPRWPKACSCGYEFKKTDRWQIFFDDVMKRNDTGEEISLRDAPPGAMWDAWWYGVDSSWTNPQRPDSVCLMLKTPGGDWYVDGRSRQGGFWTRTGDPRSNPPTVTATPSILIEPYHGWLRDGKLVAV